MCSIITSVTRHFATLTDSLPPLASASVLNRYRRYKTVSYAHCLLLTFQIQIQNIFIHNMCTRFKNSVIEKKYQIELGRLLKNNLKELNKTYYSFTFVSC